MPAKDAFITDKKHKDQQITAESHTTSVTLQDEWPLNAKKRKKAVLNIADLSKTALTANGALVISRERQVANHKRHTARGVKKVIMQTCGSDQGNEIVLRAWNRSLQSANNPWRNWVEEMFNAALHVVCTYFERHWEAIERGLQSPQAVFEEAKFALEAFGSYDGQQPHTQLNAEIFEFVTNQFYKWIAEQFADNFAAFAKHLLNLFITGEIAMDKQVVTLRAHCRRNIAEPRSFGEQLRRSVILKKRKASSENASLPETATNILARPQPAPWNGLATSQVSAINNISSVTSVANTIDCQKKTSASKTIDAVRSLQRKTALLDDLAALEK